MEISAKEARSKFRSILDQVEEGDEVIIRRRGKEIARLVPPRGGVTFRPVRFAVRLDARRWTNGE